MVHISRHRLWCIRILHYPVVVAFYPRKTDDRLPDFVFRPLVHQVSTAGGHILQFVNGESIGIGLQEFVHHLPLDMAELRADSADADGFLVGLTEDDSRGGFSRD